MMETDISGQPGPREKAVQRNRALVFLVRHKFSIALALIAIFLAVYYVMVNRARQQSDFVGFRLALILKEQIPELKKEISFGDSGTWEGCNFYLLRKCLALQTGIEIHQKPEALAKLAEFLSDPCRSLALKDLEELARGKTTQGTWEAATERMRRARGKNEQERANRVFEYLVARWYLDCDVQPEYDRPTKKLVLNVYKNLSAPSNVIRTENGGTFYLHDDLILSYRVVKHIN